MQHLRNTWSRLKYSHATSTFRIQSNWDSDPLILFVFDVFLKFELIFEQANILNMIATHEILVEWYEQEIRDEYPNLMRPNKLFACIFRPAAPLTPAHSTEHIKSVHSSNKERWTTDGRLSQESKLESDCCLVVPELAFAWWAAGGYKTWAALNTPRSTAVILPMTGRTY